MVVVELEVLDLMKRGSALSNQDNISTTRSMLYSIVQATQDDYKPSCMITVQGHCEANKTQRELSYETDNPRICLGLFPPFFYLPRYRNVHVYSEISWELQRVRIL